MDLFLNSDEMHSSFSPFSPAMMWEKRNRNLLIQFLAAELIATYRGLCRNAPIKDILACEKRFFPYDWGYPYGHLNKLREHTMILEYVFPELPGPVMQYVGLVSKTLNSPMRTPAIVKSKVLKRLPELFFALEPFMERCRENENLIFFLLKHKEEIDQFTHLGYLHSFLLRLHPSGLAELCEKLCDNYHHRGFYFLIPEIKLLLTKLEHAS